MRNYENSKESKRKGRDVRLRTSHSSEQDNRKGTTLTRLNYELPIVTMIACLAVLALGTNHFIGLEENMLSNLQLSTRI